MFSYFAHRHPGLFILFVGAASALAVFLGFLVFTPCSAPEFKLKVHSGFSSTAIPELAATPKLSINGHSASVAFANYDDLLCVAVTENPAGSEFFNFFSLDTSAALNVELPHCYLARKLLKSTDTLTFTASNRAGTTIFTIHASWAEGFNDHSPDRTANTTTKPSAATSTTPTTTSTATTTTSTTPTTTPKPATTKPASTAPATTRSGLSRATAERVCSARLEREYELSDLLSATISGDSWVVELEGVDEDYPAGHIITAECHVSGTNSSPRITYYYEDVYKDFYYDDGDLEYCYYGYDEATGTCR